MSYLYDKPFKVGFCLTIAFFLVGNGIDQFLARGDYFRGDENTIIVNTRFIWGKPLTWTGYGSNYFENGFLELVLNVVVVAVTAFLVGFVFRYFAAKIGFGTRSEG